MYKATVYAMQDGIPGRFTKKSENIELLLQKTEQLLKALHGEKTAKSLKAQATKKGITYKGYLFDKYGNRTKYKIALARITEIKED